MNKLTVLIVAIIVVIVTMCSSCVSYSGLGKCPTYGYCTTRDKYFESIVYYPVGTVVCQSKIDCVTIIEIACVKY